MQSHAEISRPNSIRRVLTASRRQWRWWSIVALMGFVMSSIKPATSQAPAPPNEPPAAPIQILVFPQRDFVSASGYDAADQVIVDVIHPNNVTFSTDPANPVIPQADPRALPGAPFAGIVEVNHPGGACWFTTTPDIRPGDIVRIEIVGGPNAGRKDQTTVANVTAQRPVETAPNTVVVHGTAVAADGVSQIPIAQLEQRLVANKDSFDLNGRRTLRAINVAGADGTLAYDAPTATTWTATYTGLSAADVTRALGSESRILWLGRTPQEGTIFEIGAAVFAGPAAPCTAPLEVLPPPPGSELIPPTIPVLQSAVVTNSNTVTLT